MTTKIHAECRYCGQRVSYFGQICADCVDETLAADEQQPAGDPFIDPKVAWARDESDPCQRGTVGCCIDHTHPTASDCETW
jgi:hypothetical protein